MSPYSFVGVGEPARSTRRDAVFADVDPNTRTISTRTAVEAVIMPAHEGDRRGRHLRLSVRAGRAWSRLRARRPALVEDACQGRWARATRSAAGRTAIPRSGLRPHRADDDGEGGAVTIRSAEEHRAVRVTRNQGRLETSSWLQHGRLGFNYRLDDISAALGIGQLEKLDRILARARRGRGALRRVARRIDVELPLADDADHERSWFVYVVKLPQGVDRDGVIGALGARRHRGARRTCRRSTFSRTCGAVRLHRGHVPGERGLLGADDGDPVPRAARARGPGTRGRGAARGARVGLSRTG